MRPLDNIAFYSELLACGPRLIYPYLVERVMCQSGFQWGIPRDFSLSAHPAMVRRDIDAMFDTRGSTKCARSLVIE